MALTEYNYTLGQTRETIGATQTVTAVTGGATNLGGTIGVRVLVDDAAISSNMAVKLALTLLETRIKEDTWPPSLAINAG